MSSREKGLSEEGSNYITYKNFVNFLSTVQYKYSTTAECQNAK